MIRRTATLAFGIVLASSSAACEARLDAAPARNVHGYEAVAVTPPIGIVSNPRIFYRGSYAYLYDERWFYATKDGWVYFRTEPEPLYEYRTRYAKARKGRDGKPASLASKTPMPGR